MDTICNRQSFADHGFSRIPEGPAHLAPPRCFYTIRNVVCVAHVTNGFLSEDSAMSLGTTPASAIPRLSLTSAVADKLRDQIIRGEIAEGTQLRQDAIATQ